MATPRRRPRSSAEPRVEDRRPRPHGEPAGMTEDLVVVSQRLLASILSLGVFSLVSLGYAMFALAQPVNDDTMAASRSRAVALACVLVLALIISKRSLDTLAQALAVCEILAVKVSTMFSAVAGMWTNAPPSVRWGILGIFGMMAAGPLVDGNPARRCKLNRITAIAIAILALWLAFIATALYQLRAVMGAFGEGI